MRKIPFVVGQYYHIYNRGTDKRIIFSDFSDLCRFLQSMDEFNTLEPIGSILENQFRKGENSELNILLGTPTTKLVDFVAFCLNPNHYHFILTPVVDQGIEKFIQRLGGGFTRYYNEKYDRNGVLFQGKFKSIHIDSDNYLLHMSVYVNLNDKAHLLGTPSTKWIGKSSWDEYLRAKIIKGAIGEVNLVQNGPNDICEKSMILSHFDSIEEYKEFAEKILQEIIEKKSDKVGKLRKLNKLWLE